MILETLLYLIAPIFIFLFWHVVCEISRILAAILVGKIKYWTIKPYPHKDENGKLRFIRAYWAWERDLNDKDRGLAILLPRIANFWAVCFVAITLFITGPFKILLLLYCLLGITDLILRSIGLSPSSDLKKAAGLLKINPWWIRAIGLGFAALGVLEVIYSFSQWF